MLHMRKTKNNNQIVKQSDKGNQYNIHIYIYIYQIFKKREKCNMEADTLVPLEKFQKRNPKSLTLLVRMLSRTKLMHYTTLQKNKKDRKQRFRPLSTLSSPFSPFPSKKI